MSTSEITLLFDFLLNFPLPLIKNSFLSNERLFYACIIIFIYQHVSHFEQSISGNQLDQQCALKTKHALYLHTYVFKSFCYIFYYFSPFVCGTTRLQVGTHTIVQVRSFEGITAYTMIHMYLHTSANFQFPSEHPIIYKWKLPLQISR